MVGATDLLLLLQEFCGGTDEESGLLGEHVHYSKVI